MFREVDCEYVGNSRGHFHSNSSFIETRQVTEVFLRFWRPNSIYNNKRGQIDLTGVTTLSTFCSKMEQHGSVKDSVPNLVPKNQTDISTGIGPTGTDTPAPKDLMPHADEQFQLHSLKEPLSRPAGALFEAGSGEKCNTGDDSR